MELSKDTIEQIEKALPRHVSYPGTRDKGSYLEIMDKLVFNYTGAMAIRISKLLDDYFKTVGVNNLTEALERIYKRRKENE